MVPHLAAAQRRLISDMLLEGSCGCDQIARAAECSRAAIRYIRNNLSMFGSATAPQNRRGRQRVMTPTMIASLQDYLLDRPGSYLDEMTIFLWDEFATRVHISTISRALSRLRWTKKVIRRRAKEQSSDLRDLYLYKLSAFRSFQLVFVDESGCDKRIGFRRTGWSPSGVAPVEVTKFHRGNRFQILPAYTQDGILLSRVFQGATDGYLFEDYIVELLRSCTPYPGPRSVVIMDNASFHHNPTIQAMCAEAGVKLLYLPPYCPDFNPIEEFFAELKAFIKKRWDVYLRDPELDFAAYLEWCINVVGADRQHARGHFRHSGIEIEGWPGS